MWTNTLKEFRELSDKLSRMRGGEKLVLYYDELWFLENAVNNHPEFEKRRKEKDTLEIQIKHAQNKLDSL